MPRQKPSWWLARYAKTARRGSKPKHKPVPKIPRVKKEREYRPILGSQRILSYDHVPANSGFKNLTESDWLAHDENPLEWLLAWETIKEKEKCLS